MNRLIFTLFCFLCSFNMCAQMDECGVKWIILGDTIDLKDSVSYEKVLMLCFYSFDAYINSYIDVTNDACRFFNFAKENNLINDDQFSFFRNREHCFDIQQNDTTATLLYGDSIFYVTLPNSVSCQHSIEGDYKRKLVKFFDENGCLYYSKYLDKKYRKLLSEINYQLIKQDYTVVTYVSTEMGSQSPVVVLYQYDSEKGLTLYKTCVKYHSLLKNEFYTRLLKLTENFCRKHHRIKKIIFAEYLFYDNTSNNKAPKN